MEPQATPIDIDFLAPRELAVALMAGDPAAFKQGYTKENAILAVIDMQKLNEADAANLREELADSVLSVYRVSLVWGGPEEGGWWYDHYEYVGTVTTPTPTWKLRELLQTLDRPESTRSNVFGPDDLVLIVENEPGESRTTDTPRYE
ncbi:MAG: hypothetical protein JHD02_00325 [Thermoleophilaceae bacterium]|nr:hypothetical protein [Thermoleophilaceae bacterium]